LSCWAFPNAINASFTYAVRLFSILDCSFPITCVSAFSALIILKREFASIAGFIMIPDFLIISGFDLVIGR
jgi:hypothetical protein